MKTDAELEQAGEAAVAEGLRLWGLNVGDPAAKYLAPPHPAADTNLLALHERAVAWRKVIDEVYQAAGWGAATPYAGHGVPRIGADSLRRFVGARPASIRSGSRGSSLRGCGSTTGPVTSRSTSTRTTCRRCWANRGV